MLKLCGVFCMCSMAKYTMKMTITGVFCPVFTMVFHYCSNGLWWGYHGSWSGQGLRSYQTCKWKGNAMKMYFLTTQSRDKARLIWTWYMDNTGFIRCILKSELLSEKCVLLNPVVGRPGLPGNAIESTAATTVVANGGLWTLGFK